MEFDIGDKIRNTKSGDTYTIIGIVEYQELPSHSYYRVLSTYLTTHRLKFKTTEHFKKIDHNDRLEDLMVWVKQEK